jgi:hypothetical protein
VDGGQLRCWRSAPERERTAEGEQVVVHIDPGQLLAVNDHG